jgi:predicted metal-dependent phosphoesterase TrpH
MIDLHTHTDRSDGSTAPGELVRQAAEIGLEALGIADHDTLAGYDAAVPFAADCRVELVCGVELSTRPAPSNGEQQTAGKRERSVHVLGYWPLSSPTAEFRRYLETQQASRRKRNVELVAKLREFGLEVTLEDAEVYGRNQVGRPHFARVLCDKGYASSIQGAFDVFLADDARAAVNRDEPTLEEGIRRITDGGGIASLAHPKRLPQRGPDLERLVEQLLEPGLGGIEVFHSEHSPNDCEEFAAIARRFSLIPTGGSDFHGENKPQIALGSGIDGNVNLPYRFLEDMREMCCQKMSRV